MVVPTPCELLEQRRRVTLASQGRDLLKDKRTARPRAFAVCSRQLLGRPRGVDDAMSEARAALSEADRSAGSTEAVEPAEDVRVDLEETR